jgi:hypothetical protein
MDWQLIEKKDTKYFQLRWKNIIALYSTRYSGKTLLEDLNPIFLKQVHSSVIVNTDAEDRHIGDGLVSHRKNCFLGIKIADCLPVFLFNARTIGVIHCGWRGILKGIAKEAKKIFKNYKYILGASIGLCCYEVKRDIAEAYVKQYRNAVNIKKGKYFIDLKAAVIKDLGKENLLASLDLCTKCHPELFYSYRRGDNRKRNYAMIAATSQKLPSCTYNE